MASYPTMYRGVEFRSRLEARWACMFDQLGWHWNYEPFDLPGWIPDFQLQSRILVEVKPFTFAQQWRPTIQQIDNAMSAVGIDGSVLLLGTEPFPPPGDGNHNTHLGWLRCRCRYASDESIEIYTDRARLYEVGGKYDFSEDEMAWGSKLGLISDAYRKWYGFPPEADDIIHKWAVATNAVKWRPQ